jgi:type IV secretory pathway VirJ component
MSVQWRTLRILGTVAMLMTTLANVAQSADKFSFGRLGEVSVYRPVAVRHVALLFSDDKGWTTTNEAMAAALTERGYLVAGIDLRHYAGELGKPRDKCSYLAGEFEDFSHELQKHFSPQRYHQPVLIGVGRAAGLVYGVTAQGSAGTFVGALTLGFSPQWQPLVRLCQSYGLRYAMDKNGKAIFQPTEQLSTPWIALHAERDKAWSVKDLREFVAKVGTATAIVIANEDSSFAHQVQWRGQLLASADQVAKADQDIKVLADELSDLPLEEVRATGRQTSRMALFLTGDGGWAEIDKGVSEQLAKRGIDVVALSSLQYFWQPRSPNETAKDVARILRHYLVVWKKNEALVIGYSFGADVAPFVVNRLPNDLRGNIRSVNLLGLAETADFEIHVTTWLGADNHGVPTRPELDRLKTRVLCVYGDGEKDSLCPTLTAANVKVVKIGDGHHFGDRYQDLAENILRQADAQ